MDKPHEDRFGWESYVWRGALGGVIGSLILVLFGAVHMAVRFGRGNVGDLLVVGSVFALTVGAIAGLAIGYIIYWLARRWGQQPGVAMRVTIGFTFFLAFSLPQIVTKHEMANSAVAIAYAILVGGVAGLMARDRSSAAPLPSSAGRA